MNGSICGEGYCNYLKGIYYGMLKDCEKGKPYDKLLDQLLIELLGAVEEYDSINLNRLYRLTSSLRYLKYYYFRSTILFKCIPLVDSIFQEG